MLSAYFISALVQTFAILLLCVLSFGVAKLFQRQAQEGFSFRQFVGLHLAGFRWDRGFTFMLVAVVFTAIVATLAQIQFAPDVLTSDHSPYFKILKHGCSAPGFIAGLAYSFIQSGFSEELLFRGLIAKRLISIFRFKIGNFLQAFVFWIVHFFLIAWLTGTWFSGLQLLVLVLIGGFGWLMGYWNERRSGGSLVSSWLLHSSVNFSTFLTLAFVTTPRP